MEGNLHPECGYLTVLEDRDDPNGRTLRIAVAALRARENATALFRPGPFTAQRRRGPGFEQTLDAAVAAPRFPEQRGNYDERDSG
jgi:hypothetical protein